MKRLIPLLIILAACGDGGEGGRRVLEPSRLRIVAGDAQASPVAASAAAGAVFRVYGASDVASGVLPDTLITEIQGTVEGRDGIMGVSGNVELPPGTSVEYTVLQDGCGAPYIASVNPDSDARTRTLWEIPGARQNLTPQLQGLQWHVVGGDSVWASRCEMEARLKVGSEFRADTSFVAYFEPGPVTKASLPHRLIAFVGDTLVLPAASFADAHDNPYPRTHIEWTGVDGVYGPLRQAWLVPDAEGRDTVRATLHGASAATEVVALSKIGAGWTYEVTCTNGALAWAPDVAFDSLRYSYRLLEPWSFEPLVELGDTAVHAWVVERESMIDIPTEVAPIRDGPSTQVFRVRQTTGMVAMAERGGVTPVLSASNNPASEYVGDASATCVGADSVHETFRAPTL